METKLCIDCKQTKEVKHFYKKRVGADGAQQYGSYCRLCTHKRWTEGHRTPRKKYELPATKVCRDCGKEKKITEFYKRAGRQKGQVDSYCKPCKYWRDQARAGTNRPSQDPERKRRYNEEIGRWKRLERDYNVTKAQFEAMLEEQEYRCATCPRSIEDLTQARMDHDHACCPGKKSCGKCVRGILCHNCNVVLGLVADSIEVLSKMTKYLSQGALKWA